jgi:hypothetical protein
MTFLQGKKLTELHAEGWVSIPDPANSNNLGGPAFVIHPDGRTFVVGNDGSLEEYTT